MSGIFFTKDQLVSVTGGVKNSSYSGNSEHKKLYIENINFKESKKLLEHINIYIRKYSKPGYRPDRYTPNFISKASGTKVVIMVLVNIFWIKKIVSIIRKTIVLN